MSATPALLSIVQLGGYPDFGGLYRRAGYRVVGARTLRQALAALRAERPAVVVAEFIYGPMYSTRVSNLETLVAGMQRETPEARLIVLFDREDTVHLERLRPQLPLFATLPFPVAESDLAAALQRAAGAA